MRPNRALVQSAVLHLGLILLLVVSVDFTPPEVTTPARSQEIVSAKVIDQTALAAEAERVRQAEEKARRAQEQAAERIAERAREEEQKKREEAARAKEQKKREEAARAKELKAERERQSKEREAAKQRAEAERQAAAEKAAEQARRAAEAAKAEAAAAEKAARQKALEEALQAELAAEEAAAAAAAQAAADSAQINRYIAAIQNRVRQSYTLLPGLDGLTCTLLITLIPGGEVVAVEVVKSSGSAPFDRQAENAVRKASPLPVPVDPRLFQQMRRIQFVFDPQH